MLFDDITAGTNIEVLRKPSEYLLFGFDPPVVPVAWDSGDVAEPGFAMKTATVKHSPPYRMSLGSATKLLFAAGSTSTGVLMLIKPSERVAATWTGIVGDLIRYDLPINTIILRNTSGVLRQTAVGGLPATCQKRFYCGSLRHIVGSGSVNAGTVADFEGSGYKTFAMTHLNKVWLQNRGFLDSYANVAFRLAFVPAGVSRAEVVKLAPNQAGLDSGPVNSIKFSFSTPAAEDCRLIGEYSSAEGWKPLTYIDATDGATHSGIMHFEPPADWGRTSRWDETVDIGGGVPGSGPGARWIRLQRRGGAGSGPVIGSAPQPYNAPYALVTRANPLRLDYTNAHVGQSVLFRFTPVNQDGQEDFSAAGYYHHVIKGT